MLMERDQPWFEARLPLLHQRVRARLDQLAARLGDADWLDGPFSAGDLLMVTVLRRLGASTLLDAYPTLGAYIARAEARPAYQRAFAAQLAVFTALSAS
jgi:glutathione S-transferase